MAAKDQQKLSKIPSVNTLLERKDILALMPEWSFAYVSFETKKIIGEARKEVQDKGVVLSEDIIAERIIKAFDYKRTTLIKPVINATGVALHTNLGRAPMSRDLIEQVTKNCISYCNLEYDLALGKRSKRGSLAGEIAAVLTGMESGVIVNNNAAAILLTVNCCAKDKYVLVSRGEQIQIGGGFRIPEMIEASGALLKEVGTTNRTVLSDYSRHIGKNTGLILKVHRSNFDLVGFTEEVSPAELTQLANKKNIPILYDLGSGMISNFGLEEFNAEPSVEFASRSKADMICFSGDKLLGGPQAGIIVGKKKYINKLRAHPLYRPLRPDKFTLSAIEQTLLGYLANPQRIQLNAIFKQGQDKLRERAELICRTLDLPFIEPSKMKSTAGGGSTPTIDYNGFGIVIKENYIGLDSKLRKYNPPIVIRMGRNRAMLDLTTVMLDQDEIIIKALKECL